MAPEETNDEGRTGEPEDDAGERRGPYARTFDKRRREIQAAAWAMIAETRGSDFTLQELSKRCDVSLRTIYNAFGDKDGVIAAAAAAHHHETLNGLEAEVADSWPLESALEMTRRIASETIRYPGFSQVTSEMYFSPRGHPKLAHSLRQMPASILRAWLRSGEADDKLVRAFGQERLEASHSDAQWALVSEWSAGLISGEEMELRMVANLLLVAVAFGNRKGRSMAKQMIAAGETDRTDSQQ